MIPIPRCDAEWHSPKVQQEIQDVGMVALRMRMPQTRGSGNQSAWKDAGSCSSAVLQPGRDVATSHPSVAAGVFKVFVDGTSGGKHEI
jgi:hypothetical protein